MNSSDCGTFNMSNLSVGNVLLAFVRIVLVDMVLEMREHLHQSRNAASMVSMPVREENASYADAGILKC